MVYALCLFATHVTHRTSLMPLNIPYFRPVFPAGWLAFPTRYYCHPANQPNIYALWGCVFVLCQCVASVYTKWALLLSAFTFATLASLQFALSVTTVTVKRSFSSTCMRQVKTRLWSWLGENTLDQAMRVCTEGPPTLSDSKLDTWKKYQT